MEHVSIRIMRRLFALFFSAHRVCVCVSSSDCSKSPASKQRERKKKTRLGLAYPWTIVEARVCAAGSSINVLLLLRGCVLP
jgi:hypothetical protein